NVQGEIRRLLDDLSAKNPAAKYTMEDLMIVRPTQTDPESILVETVSSSIERVLGDRRPLMASPGTYDQKHVTRIGHIEDCIAYGPGILDLAHQPDEYVVIEDLIQSAKVMALTAMSLLGAG